MFQNISNHAPPSILFVQRIVLVIKSPSLIAVWQHEWTHWNKVTKLMECPCLMWTNYLMISLNFSVFWRHGTVSLILKLMLNFNYSIRSNKWSLSIRHAYTLLPFLWKCKCLARSSSNVSQICFSQYSLCLYLPNILLSCSLPTCI